MSWHYHRALSLLLSSSASRWLLHLRQPWSCQSPLTEFIYFRLSFFSLSCSFLTCFMSLPRAVRAQQYCLSLATECVWVWRTRFIQAECVWAEVHAVTAAPFFLILMLRLDCRRSSLLLYSNHSNQQHVWNKCNKNAFVTMYLYLWWVIKGLGSWRGSGQTETVSSVSLMPQPPPTLKCWSCCSCHHSVVQRLSHYIAITHSFYPHSQPARVPSPSKLPISSLHASFSSSPLSVSLPSRAISLFIWCLSSFPDTLDPLQLLSPSFTLISLTFSRCTQKTPQKTRSRAGEWRGPRRERWVKTAWNTVKCEGESRE